MPGVNSAESQGCLNQALGDGFVSGLKASAASGGLYYLAMRYSPMFRYRFSASARTALLVMPIFYTAWLNVEHSMHDCMKKFQPEFHFITEADEE